MRGDDSFEEVDLESEDEGLPPPDPVALKKAKTRR